MEQSLERAPEQADWHSNLGIVRRDRGDLPGALAAFRRAIELDPTHANACNNAGVLLKVAGEFEAAEAAYRTAISNDPAHADAYHNLAVVLDATGTQPGSGHRLQQVADAAADQSRGAPASRARLLPGW